jgi:hypothetical protein
MDHSDIGRPQSLPPAGLRGKGFLQVVTSWLGSDPTDAVPGRRADHIDLPNPRFRHPP